MNQEIKKQLELLPDKPGCYLMKNRDAKVIYVGKALSLKNRVRNYFQINLPDAKTKDLAKHIHSFEYIITRTEDEALVLEVNLVKKYWPKYNILLKDDKRYPFIKITVEEPFPRYYVTRSQLKDGALYFGPYSNARAVRKTLQLIEWIFPIRDCSRKLPADKVIYNRPCINYQMGKCPAPCVGKISAENYREIVKNVINFLRGRDHEIVAALQAEMEAHSKKMEFEQAAVVRDKLQNIQQMMQSQQVHFTDLKDR
ncbi:MAG: excinuclease ABC subunit UvrC, partial [Candidatus Cloacimonetes bacterium]|nr:excinuclease ABC subunit UvrC [Candidatus Cloacimonadota bacterium]